MKDGLQEFFQTIRGYSVLNNQLEAENLPMAFFLTKSLPFWIHRRKINKYPSHPRGSD
jgi:hypothetical protein